METAYQHSTYAQPHAKVVAAHTSTEVDETEVINTKKNYFFVMALSMIIGSCWGGVVAMFVLEAHAHTAILFLNVLAAMLNNIASIAQLPYRTMLGFFIGSLVVNGLILLGVLFS